MASMREVTGNTFGNDATVLLGDLINNITNVSTGMKTISDIQSLAWRY